jgi:hypothetical protein
MEVLSGRSERLGVECFLAGAPFGVGLSEDLEIELVPSDERPFVF